jgi:hypothetical protein
VGVFIVIVKEASPEAFKEAVASAFAMLILNDAEPEPEEINLPSASATANEMVVDPLIGKPEVPEAVPDSNACAKADKPPALTDIIHDLLP